jgi:acetylglutamate kinase
MIVIKIGGELLENDAIVPIAADVAALAARGDQVVMVHGAGPQTTALQRRFGIEPRVVAGRRITDQPTLEVMKLVIGRLTIDLCSALVRAGARPIGLHGACSLAVRAARRPPRVVSGGGPDPIDFGLVGDVAGFNEPLLRLLLEAGHIPVIACLGADEHGTILNINADVIANALAVALAARHLVLVTGTRGVLRDIAVPSSRIAHLSVAAARAAIADGTVVGGMIPKIEESILTLTTGDVQQVHIVGQLGPGELLCEIDAPGSIGTALE